MSLSTELSNLREIMGTSEFIVSWSEVRVDLETPKFAPEVREVLRRMVPLALSLTGLLQHTYKKKKSRGGYFNDLGICKSCLILFKMQKEKDG